MKINIKLPVLLAALLLPSPVFAQSSPKVKDVGIRVIREVAGEKNDKLVPFNTFNEITPPEKESIKGNISEGGFYSPFFIVQHAAFMILVTAIALLWTIWTVFLCDRVRNNSSEEMQNE